MEIEECTKKRLMKGTKEGLSKIHDFTLEIITDSGLHKLKVEQLTTRKKNINFLFSCSEKISKRQTDILC